MKFPILQVYSIADDSKAYDSGIYVIKCMQAACKMDEISLNVSH